MEREKWESVLIDYIDGKLNDAEKEKVENELAKNEDAYKVYEELREVMLVMDRAQTLNPNPQRKATFKLQLEKEIQSQNSTRTIFFQPMVYRAAAAIALVMLGIGLGYWINKNTQQAQELAELKKEMEVTKQAMFELLANQNSASQRIVGATVAYEMDRTDDEIVNVLVKTLNSDPNTNVRLAALDALSKFYQQPHVRKALIASLEKQTDSMVQIMLIRMLVEMKEKGIINDLKRISTDERELPAVKDEAYAGLLRLS